MNKDKLNSYAAMSLLAFGAFTGLYGLMEMSQAQAYEKSARVVNGDDAYTSASPYPEIDQAALEANHDASMYCRIGGVSLFASIMVKAWPDERK